MIAFDFTKLAAFLKTVPLTTRTCRLCNGEPFIAWEDKDKPRTIGATHHTCYGDEELLTLARKYDS